MYALVDVNGKQYKAEKGALLRVDRMPKSKGEEVLLESVLMTSDDGQVKLGTPYVGGVSVKTVVEDEVREGKIVVYKYRKRKGYRRKRGHRQSFTVLRVQDITGA